MVQQRSFSSAYSLAVQIVLLKLCRAALIDAWHGNFEELEFKLNLVDSILADYSSRGIARGEAKRQLEGVTAKTGCMHNLYKQTG